MNKKNLEGLKWLGTITSVIGAFILAFNYPLLGYSLFTVGSGAWFAVGAIQKDRAMLVLNAFFLAADFIGLYNSIK